MYFQKYHFNIYEFGFIGKLIKSFVRKCKNLNVVKSRRDVPFVVFGHISCPDSNFYSNHRVPLSATIIISFQVHMPKAVFFTSSMSQCTDLIKTWEDIEKFKMKLDKKTPIFVNIESDGQSNLWDYIVLCRKIFLNIFF